MRSVVGLGLVVLLGACSTASQPAPLGGASTLAALRAIPSVRAPSSAHLRRTDKGFVGKDSATKHAVFPVRSRGALRLESDERADVWIEVRPRDGKDVDAELVDGTLVFRAVAPSTDVVFVDERHRVEEWRLLRDAAAPTTTRYEVRVGAGVGTLRTRVGRIEVLDADGRVHLTTDDLVAIDARGERRALAVALEKQAEGYTFSLALDPAGLAFPIAVDPAWTGGPLMVTGRGAHAAVTLLDGRVLVIGGYGGGGALETNATEIYDPATNTFTASTGNGQGECQAVAMLASGLVLRAGGTTKLGPVSSASTFSHLTSAWTVAASPPYRLCGAAAVALDANRFLVCGGSNAMGATGNDCETYNPSTNTWTLVAKQNVVRSDHTLTVLGDGTVLSTGGDSGGSASATAERYNPGTNTWTNVPAMKVARSNHTATRLGSGKVLVVGNGTGTQLFDPGSSTWSDGGPLAVARTGHTATLLPDGRVLVAGGGPTSAELYDPATNTFSTAGAMITPRSRFASALLPSGRVLATGDYSSATTATEIWGQLVGASCAANHECANNHCVDNVCCSSASCAAGAVCNLAGKLGTCTKPLGASCGAGTECVSGQCVDGYCCNSACTAQCSACNVAGKLGTCTPVLGSPVGGRTACSGAGLGTTCGARCDGYDGGKCNFAPTTTACGTDGCATGVETHVGTCNGAGACNSTSKTCGLYKCGATSCLTTCTATSDCITGYRCKDGACAPAGDTGSPCLAPTDCSSKFCADGFCCEAASCGVDGSCGLPTHEGTCRTKQGKACTKNDDCGSDHCVDGVCCDLACDGQCEACDVEGKVGLCAPVTGAPHSGRPKCDDGGGDACKAKTCKGASSRVACEGYVNGPTVTCAPAKCEDSSFTTVSKCDGAGTCASPGASSCVPYKCGPTGCLKTCTKTDECAKGYACLGNRCEGVSAACSDDGLQAIGRDGVVTDCAPYRCLDTGECGKSCETSSSCGPGYACDVATKTCSPAAPPTVDSGGCSMNGGARSGSGGLLAALLGVVGIVAARRRRLLSSALGAAAAFSAGCGNRTEPPSTQGPVVTVEDPLVPAKKVPAFAARIARAEAWASKGEGFVGGQRLTAEIPLRANAAVRLGPKDRDDVFVEVVALEASEVRAVVRDSVVTFVDALPDTDVLHVVDAAGVEELRTLRSTRAPTTVRYRVTHGPGIASVRVREGRIEAVSAAGRVEIGTAPLFAVDAAGKRRSLTLSIEGDVVTAALDTTGLAFPVVVDPAWSLVATMSEPRMIHALVTLADGRLMVVGGESKTAEIYDAVANTWSSGGDTGHFYGSYPDWESGAAPLPSGKVLVRFDTADRWNPATNTWSPAGSPTVQRTAMVPLLSGKVLALCPASAATADAIVESYDDATNAWTNTTSMTTARAFCTAIRLLDGRVLVAGGRTSGGPLSSAEIFDPAASKWTATGNMVTAGGRRSALLHSSGKVVLAGPGTLAEVYDPATGKFTSLPAMATVRDRAAMAELKNGRVLVAGGVTTGSVAHRPRPRDRRGEQGDRRLRHVQGGERRAVRRRPRHGVHLGLGVRERQLRGRRVLHDRGLPVRRGVQHQGEERHLRQGERPRLRRRYRVRDRPVRRRLLLRHGVQGPVRGVRSALQVRRLFAGPRAAARRALGLRLHGRGRALRQPVRWVRSRRLSHARRGGRVRRERLRGRRRDPREHVRRVRQVRRRREVVRRLRVRRDHLQVVLLEQGGLRARLPVQDRGVLPDRRPRHALQGFFRVRHGLLHRWRVLWGRDLRGRQLVRGQRQEPRQLREAAGHLVHPRRGVRQRRVRRRRLLHVGVHGAVRGVRRPGQPRQVHAGRRRSPRHARGVRQRRRRRLQGADVRRREGPDHLRGVHQRHREGLQGGLVRGHGLRGRVGVRRRWRMHDAADAGLRALPLRRRGLSNVVREEGALRRRRHLREGGVPAHRRHVLDGPALFDRQGRHRHRLFAVPLRPRRSVPSPSAPRPRTVRPAASVTSRPRPAALSTPEAATAAGAPSGATARSASGRGCSGSSCSPGVGVGHAHRGRRHDGLGRPRPSALGPRAPRPRARGGRGHAPRVHDVARRGARRARRRRAALPVPLHRGRQEAARSRAGARGHGARGGGGRPSARVADLRRGQVDGWTDDHPGGGERAARRARDRARGLPAPPTEEDRGRSGSDQEDGDRAGAAPRRRGRADAVSPGHARRALTARGPAAGDAPPDARRALRDRHRRSRLRAARAAQGRRRPRGARGRHRRLRRPPARGQAGGFARQIGEPSGPGRHTSGAQHASASPHAAPNGVHDPPSGGGGGGLPAQPNWTLTLPPGSALRPEHAVPQRKIFLPSAEYCQPLAPPAHGLLSSLAIGTVPPVDGV
ncbi:MAG: hypothetical protein IPJ34_36750 [Myxococcales bacterium]|nr:hypothetical protein [Myxococcales bacterium]